MSGFARYLVQAACSAALLLGTAGAVAQEGSGPPPAPAGAETPAGLEARLELMERQMETMQREMEELRALLAAAREGQRQEAERAAETAPPGEVLAPPNAPAAPREVATAAPPAPPAVAAPPVSAPATVDGWEVGYRANGGGFFLRSPDGAFQFRQLGYVQFVGSVFHDDFERADAPGDFSVRRARVDWIADFHDRYQLLLEIDGGPGSIPGGSDFGLVVAQLSADLDREGTLQFVGGKLITPFSTENRISSRSIDTVERYVALNSMFLLPALDVQYGAMLRGLALDGRLEVMGGVFNGNGRANDNLSDDNGDKEVQLKFNYRTAETPGALKLGLGLDYSNEEEQSLQLRGLSFTPWVAVPVVGTRRGVSADFAWSRGPLSFRGEGLYFDFDDAGAELAGGFVQGARFLRGDEMDGLQALVRLETAALDSPLLDGPLGDRLDAVTLSLNWFWGGNVRLQVDAVGERYNGFSTLPAGASRVEGDGWKPYLLSELQIKF